MAFSFKISNRSAENLKFLFSSLSVCFFLSFALLTLARVLMLLVFAFDQYLEIPDAAKINFFVLGARYDLKVIGIAFALPLITGMLTFATGFFDKVKKVMVPFNYLMIFILGIFCVINYFYYRTYDRSIDTFIFAITKEDPMAVLKTVVNDYPVFTGSVGIAIACYVFSKIYKKSFNWIEKRMAVPSNVFSVSSLFFVLILFFAVIIRGSFGTFPLRQLNAQVCDKPAVNYCLPTAILDFYWAYKWEKESVTLPSVSADTVIADYKAYGIEVSDSNVFKPLKKTTRENDFLKENTPDIVFNVMESMSTHMLSYDDEQRRDLLGALRRNISEDFFFLNFLSEGDGTSDSMTRMLVSVPDLNLSTSSYYHKQYICNIVTLFKNAGYETIFITASTASWRNYDSYLRALGFDRVIERAQVLLEFPDATQSAWGIDDEYLFRKTFSVLKEKHDKPRFIMTLSITNHPPFRMPPGVAPQKIKLDDEILVRFPYEDTETIFATFRYANDQLGRFIDAVKGDSELKHHTFIAATGDHNMRGIGYSDHPEELVFGHQVPFYLYMPEDYVKNTSVVYDRNRLGSQKDIVTTLISHAVSGYSFYSFGCDMLSDEKCTFDFAFNNSVLIPFGKDYACSLLPFDNSISYKFMDKKKLLVKKDAGNDDCSRMAAFSKLNRDLYHFQANLDDKTFKLLSLDTDSHKSE